MPEIAKAHIEALQSPSTPQRKEDFIGAFRKYWRVFSYGVLSMTLYGMLYYFSTDLVDIARATHAGHKTMFFVPILLALVFSLVHGAFTSHFWDVLGIKAKK